MQSELPRLLDVLDYNREVLSQLLLVATIFGAFSVSGVVALLVSPERDRLRSFLFLALCVSSLAFIFATSLDAVLLPATKRPASLREAETVRGLLLLADVVVWSVICGTLSLMCAMGAFGFAYSRRLGGLVLMLSLSTIAGFIVAVYYLARLLN